MAEKYLSYTQSTRTVRKEDSDRLSKLSVPIPPDEAERLFLLRESTLFESSHTEPSFDRFCTLAKRMFKVPFVLINLIDVDRAFVKSTAGIPTMQEFSRDTSFCSYTIFPDFPEVFVVEDSHLDERFKNYFCVVNPPHVRFYAGAALILNNVRVGSLCIHGLEPRVFSTEERMNLLDLGAAVSSLIEARYETAVSQARSKEAAEIFQRMCNGLALPMKAIDQARHEVLLSAPGPGLGPGQDHGLGNAFSLSEPLTNAYDRLSLVVASTVSLGNVLNDKNKATYGDNSDQGGALLGKDVSSGKSILKLSLTNGQGLLGGGGSASGGNASGGGASGDPTVGYRCCDVLSSVEQVRTVLDKALSSSSTCRIAWNIHHDSFSSPTGHIAPPNAIVFLILNYVGEAMTRCGSITIDIDFIGNRDDAPVYSGILRQLEQLHSTKKNRKKGDKRNSSTSVASSRKSIVGGSSSGAGSSSGGEAVSVESPLSVALWKQGRFKISFILAEPIHPNGQDKGRGLDQAPGQGLGEEVKQDQNDANVDMSLPLDTFIQVVKDVGGSINDFIYHRGDGDIGDGGSGGGDSGGGGGSAGGGSSGGGNDVITTKPFTSHPLTHNRTTECYLPCALSLPPHILSSTEANTAANTLTNSLSGVDHSSSAYHDNGMTGVDISSQSSASNGHNDKNMMNSLMLVTGSHPTDMTQVSNYRPLRVLVVDDSMTNQSMLEEFFLSQGCLVDIAHHGLEALTKLQNQSIHTSSPSSGATQTIAHHATNPSDHVPSNSSGDGKSDGKDEDDEKDGLIDYYDLCLLDFLMPVMSGVDCLTQYHQWLRERQPPTTTNTTTTSDAVQPAMTSPSKNTTNADTNSITDIQIVIDTARTLNLDQITTNNHQRVNYNDHVLIIGMSAGNENENPQEVEAAYQQGMHYFCPKPIDFSILTSIVEMRQRYPKLVDTIDRINEQAMSLHTPRVDLVALANEHPVSSVIPSQSDPLDDPLNAPLDSLSVREKPLSKSPIGLTTSKKGRWKLFRRVWNSQSTSPLYFTSSAKVASDTMNLVDFERKENESGSSTLSKRVTLG